jgi:hypothetical protein
MKSFLKMHKKRTRQKHRTLKRKNVKSRKFMRGGVFVQAECGKEKTGTIVLVPVPLPDGKDFDSSKKTFHATYIISRILSKPSNGSDAEFKISKISATADGANLLKEPIYLCLSFPTPPSESYVLSRHHGNPLIHIEQTKYNVCELK